MPFAEGVPTTTIQLGGKSYTLGWTWGSKRRLKETLAEQGKDLSDANAISENLPALLWASMDDDARSSLSVRQIEELVHPGNEQEIIEKIGSLFERSEPKREPDPNAQPAAVTEPTAGISTTTDRHGQLVSTT